MSAAPLPAVSIRLLLAALGAAVALHADRSPLWCVGVAVAALAWRGLHLAGRIALPPPALRITLTLVMLAAWFIAFRSFGGLAAGSALLILMSAAKLLETRSRRDAVVTAFTILVLVLAAALDRQGLARLPLYVGTAWLALAVITASGATAASRSARLAFATAGRAALLALPLAALCFLLVPRLPGALWSAPDGGRGRTGLSDEMTPGSISELALSDEIAFRVRFADRAPPPVERYWRGPVLHAFDGETWRRGRFAVPQRSEPVSAPLRYQVTLEPHARNYLFVLDTIASVQGPRTFPTTFDSQVLATRPVMTTLTYDAVSHLRVEAKGPLSNTGRRLDTTLPAGRNPRSIALARELRASVSSDAAYVGRVLEYFDTGGFEYTLAPPPLGRESVDELLFGTRLGFCGHFASAYATLMRAVGIPARVVTGYQGGTWNPVGGYYTLYQSNAHAWTEVWLEGSGWLRVDPTTVIAPARLQGGLEDLLGGQSVVASLLRRTGWLQDLRDSWDAAGMWWQRRIVDFNQGMQLQLLQKLGLKDLGYNLLAVLLAVGIFAWLLLMVLLLPARRTRPRTDNLGRAWRDFARLLARRGVPVAAHAGPEAVQHLAARALPAAAREIEAWSREYQRLRFGRGDGPADRQSLAGLRQHLRSVARATAARHPPRTAPAAPG